MKFRGKVDAIKNEIRVQPGVYNVTFGDTG